MVEVGRDISERLKVSLANIDTSAINRQVNPFKDKNYEVTIAVLDSNTSELRARSLAFMNSFKLQKRYAEEIMKNCSSIAIVNFAMFGGDWFVTWYLMPNSRIQREVCIDPIASNRKQPWGFGTCL